MSTPDPAAGHRTTSANLEAGATRQLTEAEARKVTLGALVGTAMEWYDFFLFSAAAALVFNVQYFTNENAAAAAMASFATFGVGLVARPIGGMIFGRMGDKIGRRKTLMVTIVGIGIVTGLIGMLPTYAAIGIFAPILLPVVTAFGMDPLHFGVFMVMALSIGTITPPVGPVLFVGVRVANRRIEDVIRHLVPFFIALVVLLSVVAYTPSLSTWLPGLLGL